MNLLAYIRVSTQIQADRETEKIQIDAISKYIADNGHHLYRKPFVDLAVSGASDLDNRPGLLELIDYLKEHTMVKGVVIYCLDRLARDLVIQEHLVRDLQNLGITLMSIAEPDLCSTDPSRVLVRQILGAISQYERTIIAGRLLAGKKRNHKDGYWNGGIAPYGYKTQASGDRTILVPDNNEVSVVRDIYRMRDEGMSLGSIVRILNENNIIPPMVQAGIKRRKKISKIWHTSAVWRILTAPIYRGVITYGGEEVAKPELALPKG